MQKSLQMTMLFALMSCSSRIYLSSEGLQGPIEFGSNHETNGSSIKETQANLYSSPSFMNTGLVSVRSIEAKTRKWTILSGLLGDTPILIKDILKDDISGRSAVNSRLVNFTVTLTSDEVDFLKSLIPFFSSRSVHLQGTYSHARANSTGTQGHSYSTEPSQDTLEEDFGL